MTGTTTMTSDLHTLTYRIEPDQLGTVTVYELDARFKDTWGSLIEHVKRNSTQRYLQPRYSDLATALVAVTGQPVRMFPLLGSNPENVSKALLVTTEPIDTWLLETTFATFEQCIRNETGGKLGKIVSEAPWEARHLASYVKRTSGGQIDVPWWFSDIARWTYAARLAGQPLTVDDLKVTFRTDTDGNLLVWDNPIERPWGKPPVPSLGTTYLETDVRTMPGARDLYFHVQPHLARVPQKWYRARNAWVNHDDGGPLLFLPVTDGWTPAGGTEPAYRNHIATITQACQLERFPVPPTDPLRGDFDRFRLKGKPSSKYPIGKAVGVRFAFQIQDQIASALGAEPLTFSRTKLTAGPHIEGPIAPPDLDTAVSASGTQSLRIVGLYSEQRTRDRVVKALGEYVPEGTQLSAPDGAEIPISERVTMVFHHAPQVIGHGKQMRDLAQIPALTAPDDGAVVALVETTLPTTKEEKDDDAKPVLRKKLGALGIVSQFLDAKYEQPEEDEAPEGPDHPSKAAIRDLFRAAGVIDDRVEATLTNTKSNRALTTSATFVGLHLRQNTPRKRSQGKKSLVINLVALHAHADGTPWSVTMFDAPSGKWLPYRTSSASYYAGPIGDDTLNNTYEKRQDIQLKVDTALKGLPFDQPLVLLIDPHAGPAQKVWPGLTDKSHGTRQLPGDGTEHPDLAVVCVNTGVGATRPTHRTHGTLNGDPKKPDLPGQDLYAHQENGITTWLLAQKSRVFRGSGSKNRIGAEKTRWAQDVSKARMKDDWHLLSAVEISVPKPGTVLGAEQLAILTARLCHQAVSWDDRTRYPVPLHLALAVDKDHPGFVPDQTDDDE
jgi:hypothetical protein